MSYESTGWRLVSLALQEGVAGCSPDGGMRPQGYWRQGDAAGLPGGILGNAAFRGSRDWQRQPGFIIGLDRVCRDRGAYTVPRWLPAFTGRTGKYQAGDGTAARPVGELYLPALALAQSLNQRQAQSSALAVAAADIGTE